jgi:hypothetical protein
VPPIVSTRRRWRGSIRCSHFALLVVLGGCSGLASGDRPLLGLYRLARIGGAVPPAEFVGSPRFVFADSGWLAFLPGNRVAMMLATRDSEAGRPASPRLTVRTSTYTLQGNDIAIAIPNADPVRMRRAGTSIEAWSNERRFDYDPVR